MQNKIKKALDSAIKGDKTGNVKHHVDACSILSSINTDDLSSSAVTYLHKVHDNIKNKIMYGIIGARKKRKIITDSDDEDMDNDNNNNNNNNNNNKNKKEKKKKRKILENEMLVAWTNAEKKFWSNVESDTKKINYGFDGAFHDNYDKLFDVVANALSKEACRVQIKKYDSKTMSSELFTYLETIKTDYRPVFTKSFYMVFYDNEIISTFNIIRGPTSTFKTTMTMSTMVKMSNIGSSNAYWVGVVATLFAIFSLFIQIVKRHSDLNIIYSLDIPSEMKEVVTMISERLEGDDYFRADKQQNLEHMRSIISRAPSQVTCEDFPSTFVDDDEDEPAIQAVIKMNKRLMRSNIIFQVDIWKPSIDSELKRLSMVLGCKQLTLNDELLPFVIWFRVLGSDKPVGYAILTLWSVTGSIPYVHVGRVCGKKPIPAQSLANKYAIEFAKLNELNYVTSYAPNLFPNYKPLQSSGKWGTSWAFPWTGDSNPKSQDIVDSGMNEFGKFVRDNKITTKIVLKQIENGNGTTPVEINGKKNELIRDSTGFEPYTTWKDIGYWFIWKADSDKDDDNESKVQLKKNLFFFIE